LEHTVEQFADPAAASERAAGAITESARAAIAARGRFVGAVSGGGGVAAMFAALAGHDIAWDRVTLFQVDERVAPDGDPDRNFTALRLAFGDTPAELRPMSVTRPDLAAAAGDYATVLPERFDLVHLGLGPDGHTASLVPGDPVLDVVDRLVAVTRPYQGRVRLTLTYPALARADQLLWLVTGADKAAALRALLAGDRSIPAARVRSGVSLVVADAAAGGA